MSDRQRLKHHLESCSDDCHGYISDIEQLKQELADIKAKNELLQGQLELKNLEFIRMENAWRGEVKYYQRLYEDGYVDE